MEHTVWWAPIDLDFTQLCQSVMPRDQDSWASVPMEVALDISAYIQSFSPNGRKINVHMSRLHPQKSINYSITELHTSVDLEVLPLTTEKQNTHTYKPETGKLLHLSFFLVICGWIAGVIIFSFCLGSCSFYILWNSFLFSLFSNVLISFSF